MPVLDVSEVANSISLVLPLFGVDVDPPDSTTGELFQKRDKSKDEIQVIAKSFSWVTCASAEPKACRYLEVAPFDENVAASALYQKRVDRLFR